MNLVYPTPAETALILPDLVARDRATRVGLKMFPVVSKSTFKVSWIQWDNAYGLMAFRGIDGAPPRVVRLGANRFMYEPGVYGEHIAITEKELLERSIPNMPNIPIPIGDLVAAADAQLIQRQDDRMEANIWALLTTGTLSIAFPGPNGPSVYKDTYTFQTYSASVPWSTLATSTPIADFQNIQQKQLGHSADFGAAATAYMNQVQANRMMNNTNASDFGGRRSQAGATLNSLPAFNSYLAGQNLPQIQVVDDGYMPFPVNGPITTPATQFVKFIPDGTAVVVGKRPGGAPVGETQMTLQIMNPGGNAAPGEYHFIKDYAQGINAPVEVPPKVEIHRGYNGGLAIEYPNAIVVATL